MTIFRQNAELSLTRYLINIGVLEIKIDQIVKKNFFLES